MNILWFISSVLNFASCFCLSCVILETSVNPMGLFGQELVAMISYRLFCISNQYGLSTCRACLELVFEIE